MPNCLPNSIDAPEACVTDNNLYTETTLIASESRFSFSLPDGSANASLSVRFQVFPHGSRDWSRLAEDCMNRHKKRAFGQITDIRSERLDRLQT
ncbi:hypothetical protein RRG08_061903 [Elysia crispata]|uniref:Uncharacterized protein n=1 Tax=Elysia crispata TaxID=231223 RepID=A0AAE1A604_9GAST|nr:hypothetical protein RRG08_061903 [Elysia crispata]